jgi:hypothetical protein
MTLLGIIFLALAFVGFLFGWHPTSRGYGYSFAGVCLCVAVALFRFGPQLLR